MAPGSKRGFNCSWDQCGKSFKRNSDLCRHYRIHTNERPYRCTVADCNKSFVQRGALTVHSRTHTGEKPHVCDNEGCQKAFSDSSSLARHRRIHTGKRPYICHDSICERSFCRKATLAKHQQRFHPPESLIRPSSEDATPEYSYHKTPESLSSPNGQYMLLQKPYYPQSAPPSHDFYSPQNVHMVSAPVHKVAPTTLPQNALVSVNCPMNMPQAQHPQNHPHSHTHQQQQQYVQMMQLHYEVSCTNYNLAVYDRVTLRGRRGTLDESMMASYHPDYLYKSPRSGMPNQSEGTDWNFLGVDKKAFT